MTNNQNDPRVNFAPRFLPWVLAGISFLIYLITLNHWVSLMDLPMVARISGWIWQPDISSPILLAFTLPFRWLPAASVPMLLNLFAAICAAATVGLLARTVAILPQDRTDAQRRREHSVFSFLTIKSAWLPPTLAAAVCGLQIVYWEHATNFTGESFQLLFFALVIWLLAEYRIDEREGRLYLAAFVWGACMVDNWAMVGFLPVFIGAVLWMRGWAFFHLRFLARMFLLGIAGIMLYLATPLYVTLFTKLPLSFWDVLKYELVTPWQIIKMVGSEDIRHTLGLISLTTIVPLILMGIRWKTTFGDISRTGKVLADFMFHVIHVLIFGVCLWVAFDPPFSPHQLGGDLGFSEPPPQLTFLYLDAICVGYFGGYLLLVLGRRHISRSSKARQVNKPVFLQNLSVGVIGTVGVLAMTVLFWKNMPQILELNDKSLLDFGKLATENLPGSGILLSDSNEGPFRDWIVQSYLTREGKAKNFVMLDTQSLEWPMYHRYLHEKYGERWPLIVDKSDTKGINPIRLVGELRELAKTNQLCYLHPSFGYYFESFYLEPHGMVYYLKLRDATNSFTPDPDDALVTENQQFWKDATELSLDRIAYLRDPKTASRTRHFGDSILARLHIHPLSNPNIPLLGDFYSESLNYWGVRLQRAQQLKLAASCFEQAQKLNPDNEVARINYGFNQDLQANKKPVIDLGEANSDRLGKYRTWTDALNVNGPFDEPSFCYYDGLTLARNGFFYQSGEEFKRINKLVPDDLQARLGLAQAYIFVRKPELAEKALQDPLDHPEKYSLNASNSTEINVLASAVYFQLNETAKAARLLDTETELHPDNNELLTSAAQAFIMHGMFTNALTVIDRRLDLVPNDPVWLFGRGYANIQLRRYDKAISAFTLVLTLQTNNYDALFNRAVSYLQSGKWENARADYLRLQQKYTNSFLLAYGLGEVAYQLRDTNELIRNYNIYLANANTNTAEAKMVRDRLNQFQPK